MNAKDRVSVRLIAAALGLLLTATIGFAQGDSIVADVVPTGNRLIPKEQILGQIRTKPGNRFSQATLE